jgi:hypothetical protein
MSEFWCTVLQPQKKLDESLFYSISLHGGNFCDRDFFFFFFSFFFFAGTLNLTLASLTTFNEGRTYLYAKLHDGER